MGWFRDLIARVVMHRFWATAFLAIACSSLAIASYHYVAEIFKRPILLLTGPEGSNAIEIGDTLHVRFSKEPAWKFFGRSFSVTSQQTAGSKENRERVNNDRDGVLLGIGLDGFDGAPHVKGVLPLGDLRLLILANTTLLDRITYKQDADTTTGSAVVTSPPTFSQIAEYARQHTANDGDLSRPRFYLGPEGSGTREIAKTILDYYAVPLMAIDTDSQLGFVNAAYAVESGAIDLAFFMVPPTSTFVLELARRGTVRLVDLDKARGLAASSAVLASTTFPSGTINRGFPDSDVTTVSARMMIFCSDSMPENDVYWLTSAIDDFLRDEGLIRDGKPGDAAATERIDKPVPNLLAMAYPPHPGAKLYHEKRQPWYVASTRNSIRWLTGAVLAFLGTLVSAVLGGWFWGTAAFPGRDKSKADDQELRSTPLEIQSAKDGASIVGLDNPGPEDAFLAPEMLLARISVLMKDVDNMPRPTTHDARMKLFPRYSLLRHQADSSEQSRQFPEHEFDDVHAALSELEINFFSGARTSQRIT
jgi:TRAP-type uncharacterized transport system substrate-binding protein